MTSSDWSVEPTERPGPPPWRIRCPDCDDRTAPILSSDPEQAAAWADSHHDTPMLTVEIAWRDDRPSADWVYGMTAQCILRAVLQVPGARGAETGYGGYSWATGIYGLSVELDEATAAWLGRLVSAELDSSPLDAWDDRPGPVQPMTDARYERSQMMTSNYTARHVAWVL